MYCYIAASLVPQEQPLLASAQDNLGTRANSVAPSRGAVMKGLASGASVACYISMLNGSAIYLMTADVGVEVLPACCRPAER